MNSNEFQVGDLVVIADRDTLRARDYAPNIVSEMLNYAGRIVTVKRISLRSLKIEEDGGTWNWPFDALQPILEEIAQPDVEEFAALLSSIYGT